MAKKYFIFDLDGTLTNPKQGITRCVQYALESFGIHEPNADLLECYIGPPLDESFMKFHGLDENQAQAAVEKYRERFADIGIFENEVIDGIEDCLKELKRQNAVIALASCKPEIFAVKILEHYNLMDYFTVAAGSSLDGTIRYKTQVIDEVFRRLSENSPTADIISMKADAVMIGDRKDDILGAQLSSIESVGVKFGYCEPDELENAGADYIVDTVEELKALLVRL